MLPFALGIGEAEVDPFDLLVLDPRQDCARVIRHALKAPISCLSSGSIKRRDPDEAGDDDANRAWTFRFPTRATESGGRRIFHSPWCVSSLAYFGRCGW